MIVEVNEEIMVSSILDRQGVCTITRFQISTITILID
jgi:hypothetical protein